MYPTGMAQEYAGRPAVRERTGWTLAGANGRMIVLYLEIDKATGEADLEEEREVNRWFSTCTF